MAIEQVQITAGDSWVKISKGDCVIQTPNNKKSSVEFVISDTAPSVNASAFSIDFGSPTTIGALGSSVWVRRKAVKQTKGLVVSVPNTDMIVARAPLL